jgi:adenylate kinase
MESLHELNVQPTLIVIIDAADDVILKRLTLRRTDPITG